MSALQITTNMSLSQLCHLSFFFADNLWSDKTFCFFPQFWCSFIRLNKGKRRKKWKEKKSNICLVIINISTQLPFMCKLNFQRVSLMTSQFQFENDGKPDSVSNMKWKTNCFFLIQWASSFGQQRNEPMWTNRRIIGNTIEHSKWAHLPNFISFFKPTQTGSCGNMIFIYFFYSFSSSSFFCFLRHQIKIALFSFQLVRPCYDWISLPTTNLFFFLFTFVGHLFACAVLMCTFRIFRFPICISASLLRCAVVSSPSRLFKRTNGDKHDQILKQRRHTFKVLRFRVLPVLWTYLSKLDSHAHVRFQIRRPPLVESQPTGRKIEVLYSIGRMF